MGLGSRNATKHDIEAQRKLAGVDPTIYWDHRPGDRVMTCDGYPGVVTAVHDGPHAGSEEYQVKLDNGIGGGAYVTGQLNPISSSTEASTVHTADQDYPELGNLLHERPDPALDSRLASRTAMDYKPEIGLDELPPEEHHHVPPNSENYPEHGDPGSLDHGGDSGGDSHVANFAGDEGESLDGVADDELTSTAAEQGAEPDFDETHGGLTWDGHSPATRDTGEYSMFGSGDPTEKYAKSIDDMYGHPEQLNEWVKSPGAAGVETGHGGRKPYSPQHATEDFLGKHPTDSIRGSVPLHVNNNEYDDQTSGDSSYTYPVYNEKTQEHEPKTKTEQGIFSLNSLDPCGLIAEAATDSDLRFYLTASWNDVRTKARRIRSEGGVNIISAHGGIVVGYIKGDTNTYETGLEREPGKGNVGIWNCGCKWAAYSWGRSPAYRRFEGRMCSHALALHYEAMSRGMFGKSVYEDRTMPSWLKRHSDVVIRYDPDTNVNVKAASIEVLPIHGLLAEAKAAGEAFEDIQLLLSVAGITAAVSSPWGEPMPNPVPTMVGGTSPRIVGENPVSAGPLSGADPKHWDNQRLRTRTQPDLDRYSILHEEPEAALPSTDGADEDIPAAEQGWPTMGRRQDDDEFLFEAELDKLANPALLAAVPELLGAGGVGAEAGAAGGGTAEMLGGALPGLMGGGESEGGGADEDAGSKPDESAPAAPPPSTGEEAIRDPAVVSRASLSAGITSEEAVNLRSVQAAADPSEDSSDIAAAAAAFLATGELAQAPEGMLPKMSMKSFSPAEQAALINEGAGSRAGNLDLLQIQGTHYEHIKDDEHNLDEEGWMA
jgi:hypothetical protein